MTAALRPHQERALSSLRNSLLSGYWRPMLQMPTGAGKTRVAAEIIRARSTRVSVSRSSFPRSA